MNHVVTEFDVAVLKIGDKKFIGSLFTVLSMCDDVSIITKDDSVKKFRLNLPRNNYPSTTLRIQFTLLRHMYTHEYDYFQYKCHLTSGNTLEKWLLEYLKKDRTLRQLRVQAEPNYYRS